MYQVVHIKGTLDAREREATAVPGTLQPRRTHCLLWYNRGSFRSCDQSRNFSPCHEILRVEAKLASTFHLVVKVFGVV